jgi:hypothetical protein
VVIFVGTVPTVWLFVLELFQQCGYLCWNISDSVVISVGTVPTVWLFVLELFRQCGYLCWNCSDSVVIFVVHVIDKR